MGQVGIGAAEVEMEFHPDHGSPFLGGGTDLELERPRVSGLLVELPVRVRHRVGPLSRPGASPARAASPSLSRIRSRTQAVSTPASMMRCATWMFLGPSSRAAL